MTGAGGRDQRVQAVTRSRVEAALAAEGYRYQIRGDGSILGTWDGNRFTIALVGPEDAIVKVHGTWHGSVAADLAPALAQVVNDWNRDRIWPKVYTAPDAVGGVRVHTAVAVDLTDGATDAQVAEAIACGLGTGVQFFANLADLLADEAPPEDTTPRDPGR